MIMCTETISIVFFFFLVLFSLSRIFFSQEEIRPPEGRGRVLIMSGGRSLEEGAVSFRISAHLCVIYIVLFTHCVYYSDA